MRRLILPDDGVVGIKIKTAHETAREALNMPIPYFHPWKPMSLDLFEEIICRIDGVSHVFVRPDDLSYMAEFIPTYDDACVDFRHADSGGFLRLTFRREDGDIVDLSSTEYHPLRA